jgi:predicted DCC family thiol-disulfide oxidoreductase YuxK
MQGKHLLFYDGECGLCDHIVQFVLRKDKKEVFVFAPLQGETAARVLKDLPAEYKNLDSIVLIKDYQTPEQETYVMGKGAFKVLWLLGGGWALLGSLSFMPAFLYDWGYRLVAKNRHRLFSQRECMLPDPKTRSRFLP